MENFILLFVTTILCAACATEPVAPKEMLEAREELAMKKHLRFSSVDDFHKAIDQGDLEAVKLYMKTTAFFPYSRFISEGNEQNAYVTPSYVLDRAVTHPEIFDYLVRLPVTQDASKQWVWKNLDKHLSVDDKRYCPDQVVKSLIGSGSVPSSDIFEQVAALEKVGCFRASSDIIEASPKQVSRALIKVYREGIGHDVMDVAVLDKVAGRIRYFKQFSDKRCTPTTVEECQLSDEFDAYIKEIGSNYAEAAKAANEQKVELEKENEKNRADAEYERKGLAARDSACSIMGNLKNYEEELRAEQEIGRTGGFVNKDQIYRTSRMIAGAKDVLKARKADYQKKSGKAFDAKSCPKAKPATEE